MTGPAPTFCVLTDAIAAGGATPVPVDTCTPLARQFPREVRKLRSDQAIPGESHGGR